MVVAGGVIPQ